jgi:predicted transcriptional regulator
MGRLMLFTENSATGTMEGVCRTPLELRISTMAYPFPPMLDQLVREELATGVYRSEDEVLVEAMQALRDRNEATAGIREGLSDLDAGRVRSLGNVDAELRTKYGIAPNT